MWILLDCNVLQMCIWMIYRCAISEDINKLKNNFFALEFILSFLYVLMQASFGQSLNMK